MDTLGPTYLTDMWLLGPSGIECTRVSQQKQRQCMSRLDMVGFLLTKLSKYPDQQQTTFHVTATAEFPTWTYTVYLYLSP